MLGWPEPRVLVLNSSGRRGAHRGAGPPLRRTASVTACPVTYWISAGSRPGRSVPGGILDLRSGLLEVALGLVGPACA
jgi:hypothetical protein